MVSLTERFTNGVIEKANGITTLKKEGSYSDETVKPMPYPKYP